VPVPCMPSRWVEGAGDEPGVRFAGWIDLAKCECRDAVTGGDVVGG
jgi:hypothetical protein